MPDNRSGTTPVARPVRLLFATRKGTGMPDINRLQPPRIRQALTDSCWAAVIESWSKMASAIPSQQESRLVSRWGEGATGGITPSTKVPQIANALGLAWGGFPGPALGGYLARELGSSHIFCAYPNGIFAHAVLIYRLSDRGNVSFMDPATGQYRWRPLSWFAGKHTLALMRCP